MLTPVSSIIKKIKLAQLASNNSILLYSPLSPYCPNLLYTLFGGLFTSMLTIFYFIKEKKCFTCTGIEKNIIKMC